MRALHDRLYQELSDLGIPHEGRAYTPHVTLGRVARGSNSQAIQQALEAAAEQVEVRFDVNEVMLLASLREQGKMTYQPLDVVELQ